MIHIIQALSASGFGLFKRFSVQLNPIISGLTGARLAHQLTHSDVNLRQVIRAHLNVGLRQLFGELGKERKVGPTFQQKAKGLDVVIEALAADALVAIEESRVLAKLVGSVDRSARRFAYTGYSL